VGVRALFCPSFTHTANWLSLPTDKGYRRHRCHRSAAQQRKNVKVLIVSNMLLGKKLQIEGIWGCEKCQFGTCLVRSVTIDLEFRFNPLPRFQCNALAIPKHADSGTIIELIYEQT
jgi:hypothetical protein